MSTKYLEYILDNWIMHANWVQLLSTISVVRDVIHVNLFEGITLCMRPEIRRMLAGVCICEWFVWAGASAGDVCVSRLCTRKVVFVFSINTGILCVGVNQKEIKRLVVRRMVSCTPSLAGWHMVA